MQSASQIVLALRNLDSENNKPISVIMCSGGGEETAGWAIYDALYLIKSKTTCIALGNCMSMAALIMQGFDERILSPNCRFMIHDGVAEYPSMPLDKINVALKEENKLTQMYYEKLAEKANVSVDQIKKMCNNETYMSADVAVGYGLADKVLTKTKKRNKK